MTRGHEVVRTRGGAMAIRSLAEGEVMHPGVGPLVEAEELYVRQSRLAARLEAREHAPENDGTLVLFDIGLGAGSNALAAWATSERAAPGAARLLIISFERDLGALELAVELALGPAPALASEFGMEGERLTAARGLLATGHHETARTSWRLARGDIIDSLQAESAKADVIYWDPFSPRANPESWTVAAFAAARRVAGTRCTLFTYSAATSVRVALLLAGWTVGAGAAIGEKLATTAAAVDVRALGAPLDARWLARLARSGAPLPADAPGDARSIVATLPQFTRVVP